MLPIDDEHLGDRRLALSFELTRAAPFELTFPLLLSMASTHGRGRRRSRRWSRCGRLVRRMVPSR